MSESNDLKQNKILRAKLERHLAKPIEQDITEADLSELVTFAVNWLRKNKPDYWQAIFAQAKAALEEEANSSEDPGTKELADLEASRDDLQVDLIKLRQVVASGIATEKQMESQHQKFKDLAETWKNRANQAASQGQADLEKQARGRLEQYQTQAEVALTAIQDIKQSNLQAREKLSNMESFLQRIGIDCLILSTRLHSARAQLKINEVLAAIDTEDKLKKVAELEHQVNTLEKQVEQTEVPISIQTRDPNKIWLETITALARATDLLERIEAKLTD